MPDRPDERRFDWLYGQDGPDGAGAPDGDDGSHGRSPRPDETRMMRTQPRGQVPVPPAPRPVSPPPARPPARPDLLPLAPTPVAQARRRRRRPPIGRIVLALVVLWVAFLVVVPVLAWNRVQTSAWEPTGQRPAEQPGATYLLVGSDSRADLTAAERRELATGNPEGQRTDTIMLLHTGSGPDLLMSIPRDSLVDIPGRGVGKINSAYAFGGAPLLVRTIEQDTGIRVDGYAEIGLGGVVDMVDAVGGIEICPNHRMRDPLAGLDVRAGCQQADGETALAYSRSRHTNRRLGDVARARQQREVVKAVGRKAVSPWTFVDPLRYYRLNMAVPAAFGFGDGMSSLSAGRFGWAMTRVGGSGLTCGVPIRDLAVTWDDERAGELFAKIISDDTESIGKDLCNPSGLAP